MPSGWESEQWQAEEEDGRENISGKMRHQRRGKLKGKRKKTRGGMLIEGMTQQIKRQQTQKESVEGKASDTKSLHQNQDYFNYIWSEGR